MTEPPRIFPALRYRDPAAMIDWLVRAFGFTLHARHGEGDRVEHAELAYGSAMIMLGTVRRRRLRPHRRRPGPGQRQRALHRHRRRRRDARPRRRRRREDRGGPDRPRLRQPRVHLPRPRGHGLVLRHLLAEGVRPGLTPARAPRRPLDAARGPRYGSLRPPGEEAMPERPAVEELSPQEAMEELAASPARSRRRTSPTTRPTPRDHRRRLRRAEGAATPRSRRASPS